MATMECQSLAQHKQNNASSVIDFRAKTTVMKVVFHCELDRIPALDSGSNNNNDHKADREGKQLQPLCGLLAGWLAGMAFNLIATLYQVAQPFYLQSLSGALMWLQRSQGSGIRKTCSQQSVSHSVSLSDYKIFGTLERVKTIDERLTSSD